MKLRRLLMVFGIVALAACSHPTVPRLPQPEETEDGDPDSPGIVTTAVLLATDRDRVVIGV